MSETKNITFYSFAPSPFVHIVHLTLEEAKVPYGIINIDLLNKPAWYGEKVYPVAKVPAIVYGGAKLQADEAPSPDATVIPESLVISEFLADLPNTHLLPSDPVLRARARLFIVATQQRLTPVFSAFGFGAAPAAELLGALGFVQDLLPPTGFAVGEWSIADAAVLPFIIRLDMMLKNAEKIGPWRAKAVISEARNELASARFARLRKYIADNMARPSVASTWDESATLTIYAERIAYLRSTGVLTENVE